MAINEMKVEIVKRETIKPSSPTPDHLKNYKLSLLDQFTREIYVSLLLSYPAKPKSDIDDISKSLKSSLSKTLTYFYPYTGRIIDGASIECNDEGAIFVETQVNKVMSDVLKQPDFSILKKFLSGDDDSKEAIRGPLLQVQANFFECGGLLIGLSMSHKLTDASTLGLFLNSWAATSASNSDVTKTFSDFSMSSVLPAMDPALVPHPFELREGQFTLKRYVFDSSKIALLRAKAVSEGVENPTRVECVSGLIWKCAMAASRSRFGDERPTILTQPVNLRKRTVPPLPENSIGNIFTVSMADMEDTEIEIQGFITNIRRGIQDTSESAANGFKGDGYNSLACEMAKEMANLGKRQDIDFYMSTSWCRFPFYEADFGWGKPTWVSPSLKPFKNFFILLDSSDGAGVEAWCSLLDEDTALLERNQEFLAFAAINPNILY